MYGRSDITRYASGAKRIRNFIVRPQGGVTRRCGTEFLGETRDSSRRSILRPFVFSETQAYAVEIGHFYLRLLRNGSYLLDPIGNVLEVVTPWAETEVGQIHVSQSADVLYLSHPNYQTRTLSRYSDTDWRLALYTTTDGPYLSSRDPDTTMTLSGITDTAVLSQSGTGLSVTSGHYVEFRQDNLWRLAVATASVGSGVDIPVTYLSNLVLLVDTESTVKAQSAGGYPGSGANGYSPLNKIYSPGAGKIAADHSDVFSNMDVGKYIRATISGSPGAEAWYPVTAYDGNVGGVGSQLSVGSAVATRDTYTYPTTTLTLKSHTVTATVTASTDKFAATDVGRHMRFNFSSAQTWGIITAYTDARTVTIQLYESVPLDPLDASKYSNNGVTNDWRLGAWSDTTGWPSVSTFHEQRLTFLNTRTEPQTVWMSQTDDYGNHAPTELDSTVLDTNAITYTIASNKVDAICWVESGPSLLIGTIGGEWQVRSSSTTGAPLSPSNIQVIPQTSFGSKRYVRSVRVGNTVLFAQRAGTKVRELQYNFQSDAYVAGDISIVSDHILAEGGGIVQTAYQSEPFSMVWILMATGELACLTYEKDQEVMAWHRHQIGGVSAVVESLITLPDGQDLNDSLYLIVRRNVGGVQKRYIERISRYFPQDSRADKADASFLDCSRLTTGASPLSSVSGLDFLNGATVGVYSDGSYLGTTVVSEGSVTVGSPGYKVRVGLLFRSLLQTLPPDGGNPIGTAQGKVKRPHKAVVRLVNSIGYKHGPTEDELTEVSFRDSQGPMDDSPPLFTGNKDFLTGNTYDTEGTMVFAQDDPYPLTLLALYTKSMVGET